MFFAFSRKRSARTSPVDQARRRKLFFESLEDRRVLASIALVHADLPAYVADVAAQLNANGTFTSIVPIDVTASTPSLATLQAHDAVMVWSDFGIFDPTALGDVLADYVDSGRGVTLAWAANTTFSSNISPLGRWVSDGYTPYNYGFTYSTSNAGIGTIFDPGHPVLAGVSSFDLGGGGFAAEVILTGGTTPIADLTSGFNLAAERTGFAGKIVGLNFFPPSSAINSSSWSVGTDGGKLLANAMTYVADSVTGSLSAALAGGVLTVTDTDVTGKDNDLTVSVSGLDLVITDTTEQFASAPAGGTLSNGDRTLTIPLALISSITINTMAGNDLLTVDSSMAASGKPITYNGGNPAAGPPGDALALSGPGVFGSIVHTFVSASDGSVNLDGYAVGYTGLEPVTDNLAAVNRVFTFTGAAETVTLADSGAPADAVSTVSSTLGESVAFINPTGSLTINLTGGADTLNFNSLDSQEAGLVPLDANLIINGNGGDTVNFPATMINLGAGNANIGTTGGLPIQAINFTGGGLQTTGSVFLTAGNAIGNTTVVVDIVALNLVAIGGSGVTLDTTVANLEARGGGSGVTIHETDALIIGNISAVVGVRATAGNISVDAGGTITVNETVINVGGGNVQLDAVGGAANAAINANITATGGNGTILVTAGQDILHNSNTISAVGTGTVTEIVGRHVALGAPAQVQSDTGNIAITADNLAGNNGGAITMANGSNVNSNALVSLNADGNIQISLVQTTSAANNAVVATTTSGAITDADGGGALDISATSGGTILSAVAGIGGAGNGPTIEVNVVSLDVRNSTSGGIFVTDTAGGLTLRDLNSDTTAVSGVGGNGRITALSPLTIASNAATSGGMTYTATDSAGAGDNLTINAVVSVSDSSASLAFNAGDDFLLTNTASISAATTVTINIDAGNADGGIGATANIFGALAAPGGAAMNGNADVDTFNITGPTIGALDGITAAVTVNGLGGANNLNISDSNDGSSDIATINHTTVEGLGGSPGTDYTFSNIANLDVTATSAGDMLTTSLGGAVASPTTFNGLVNVNVRGNGGTDNMFLHVVDSLTDATLDFVNLFGDAAGDNFGGSAAADHIHPVLRTGQTQIIINGDANAKTTGPVNPGTDPVLTSPDHLYLDMTTTDSGAIVNPIVIVDTNGGYADSANTQSFRFNGIEDIDLYDNGLLTNTAIGDFYVRATENADYIEFRSAAQVDPVFRVRVGNVYYPSSTGNYGPYTTATSKVFVYGRGGNDTITMYNTRLNGVIFGEAGDDVLTGGYGNDLLIGGQGSDRLNGAAVGGNDEIWGDDFDPVADVPFTLVAASHPANRPGGNDQINTFGGNDKAYGQGGNDIINTGGGSDYVSGGPGTDTLDGQAGDDRIYGGDGVDSLNGAEGNDLLVGNAGNDTLNGRTGDDVLIGGLGADILNGHEGGDLLQGDDDAHSESLNSGDAHDLALALLLSQWVATKSSASLTPAGADGSIDTLWGGNEADLFFVTGTDLAADKNAPGYGPDL